MLKLHLPYLEQYFRRDPLVFLSTKPLVLKPGKQRAERFAVLFDRLQQSRKYIFDSGAYDDGPNRESLAVEETATAMMQAGIFRLPVSSIWIEDYFDDNPNRRYDMLVWEDERGVIRFWGFAVFAASNGRSFKSVAAIPVEGALVPSGGVGTVHYEPHSLLRNFEIQPGIMAHEMVGTIPNDPNEMPTRMLLEMAYSIKKFIVFLNSRGIEVERVERSSNRPRRAQEPNDYRYLIVRAPREKSTSRSGRARPRLHLVAGHLKYRDRPIEEQVWVSSYFRGMGNDIEEKTFIVRG